MVYSLETRIDGGHRHAGSLRNLFGTQAFPLEAEQLHVQRLQAGRPSQARPEVDAEPIVQLGRKRTREHSHQVLIVALEGVVHGLAQAEQFDALQVCASHRRHDQTGAEAKSAGTVDGGCIGVGPDRDLPAGSGCGVGTGKPDPRVAGYRSIVKVLLREGGVAGKECDA